MDSLKSAIADKVLEVSSLSGEDMKAKLEKINRFRDFVDACRSLIIKYPAIEAELLRMVENNDFDTKIASSRVDAIINLSESVSSNKAQIQENTLEGKEISEPENLLSELVEEDNEPEKPEEENDEETDTKHSPDNLPDRQLLEEVLPADTNNEVSRTNPIISPEEEPARFLPEDIDYVEVNEEEDPEKEKEYVDFEEITEEKQDDIEEQRLLPEVESDKEDQSELVEEPISQTLLANEALAENHLPSDLRREYIEPEVNTGSSIRKQDSATKETAKRGLQLVLAIAIVVALIFIIVFIIQNTERFLWGFGIATVVALIIWFFIKKKKDEDTE